MLTQGTFFFSITELAQQLKARRISPVELTEGYLDRLEKLGPRLGAVASVMRDSALKEARTAEREIRAGRYRGPLHGVPYGAKDLLATKEARTTWGATPYKEQHINEDATVIRKLREAGAILVAKLAMIELAGGMGYNEAHASWTGACRTPWNTEFWSGGSSSGPGAAVAAGLVPFAIGSETSGSIITPAAFCGITGLRPTYGRVSRHGAMALSWTLDKLGPMCRTVRDCEIVLRAIAGRDPLDPSSKPAPSELAEALFELETAATSKRSGGKWSSPKSKLGSMLGMTAFTPLLGSEGPFSKVNAATGKPRIAVMKDSYEKAQPAVRENFMRSLDVLRKFADVVMDVKLPDFPYGAAVGTIVDAEGASAFRDLIESGRVQELVSPTGRTGGYAASLVTAVDYLHAMRLRAPMRRAWSEMFSKYSLLVAPSRTTVAYPINKTFDQAYPDVRGASSPIGASNLVGVPAISVPNGFGENNLPTGIQFIGPAWSEYEMMSVADRYQQATDWHKLSPKSKV